MPDNRDQLLSDCLSLDLEVGVNDRRIHAPNTAQSLTFPAGRHSLAAALAKLDELADGVDFLLGHNLIEFDLPHLQAANPVLRLLKQPAVDTLRLNPLAFPRNPYHHLVKHYQDGQLKRGRINDPELDARLTLEVFDNQQMALADAPSDLLTAWHWLTTADGGVGFDRVFEAVRNSRRPSGADAIGAIYRCLSGNACQTHADEMVAEAARYGWPLAYALAWLSVSGGNSVMPPWVRHQFPEAGQLVRRLLLAVVKSDMFLMNESRDPARLVDRALLWLHEQEIIRLNKGLAVFRPAMTIRLKPERRGFAQADFAPLKLHYDEQVLQIHVMAEYVQRGLGAMADALRLAMDYFSLRQISFLRRWLPGRDSEISRQTTPESWRAIVEGLNNPVQRRIVADDREQTDVLVLAGPGSGKTRVLVHRIAYLIRVKRENPRGILALAYNRHAAVEIRRRLAELIGDDARGVTVLTCHALAMRLVGASFAGRASRLDEGEFQAVLQDATALLRGVGLPPEETDEHRERLLAGFRWILVDEYQDIGPDQYGLISALAGRSLSDEDDKLSLFAVGDDDQNIYAFNGAAVGFIRRFEADYGAKPAFLTDNYRSTGHIIDATNVVIEAARQRMKAGHPIEIDRARTKEPPGGPWTGLDPVARGRVQILPAGASPVSQAQVVVAELKRLSGLSRDWDWSICAVVARDWSYLDPVRSLCELEGIPVQMANEDFSGIWRLRETQALVGWLRERDSVLVNSAELHEWMSKQPSGTWTDLLQEAITEYELETGGSETSVAHCIEWLAEWAREARRCQRGLLLLTAHRAKGLEFDHVVVLDGGWDRVGRGEDADAPRRLYYVAMTRARQTLTLARFPGTHRFQDALRDGPSVLRREGPVTLPAPPPKLERRYRRLSLRDVFLSFAGYRRPSDPVHSAIAALIPGAPLQVRVESGRWELLDCNGTVVGQLAGGFKAPAGMRCTFATVLAVATWDRESSDNPQFRGGLQCDTWEVVVPELVFEPA